MVPVRWRRVARWLLAVPLVLLAFWLALPRVLGLAAERWLAIPGLESLHLDIAEIGAAQARLREVRAVYRSPGGHRLQAAMHDIALGYSLTERRLRWLDATRGELEVTPGAAVPDSPWPPIEWLRLPLGEVRIADLRVSVQGTERPILEARGKLQVRQEDGRLLAEFGTLGGLVRLAANPAGVFGEPVEFRAEWRPETGPAASALLRVGRDPAAQPVMLAGQAPLPALAALANGLGIDLPVDVADGMLTMRMEAVLGDAAGTFQTLSGDVEVTDVRGRSKRAPLPLEFALAGKLRFSWQALSTRIELQPGLRWRVDAGGKLPLQASGRLDRVFGMRLADSVVLGEDAFPFVLDAPQWGRWEGAVQRIRLARRMGESGAGGDGWSAAELQLRIKGGVREWRQDALQIRDAQAAGNVALHWSPSGGVRGEMALQTRAERLAWSGTTPVSVGRTTWKVDAGATARADGDFWKTLELTGEAGTAQVKAEFGAGQTLTLGPSRLQLSRFRPAGRKGVPSAENAEGDLQLSADAVRFGTWPAPGIRARLRLEGGSLRGDGALSLRETEALRFSGSHAFLRGCGEAAFSISQSLQTLGKSLQPHPPALLPLDLRAGEADGRFSLDWCVRPVTRIDARGMVRVRDAALAWDEARVEGVQGTVQLDGLNPLRGRISVAAQGGELATGTPLADLNIDLTLGARALTVQALRAGLLGGTMQGGPLTLDWPLAGQPLPLEIRGIDLGLLLALPKVQGLSGSGKLDGVMPLVYRAGSVEVHDGRLSSQGGGTIKYVPTLALPDNPGLQALRNFHFRHLDMRVHYAADGAYRTQTTLEGNNPDFYDGYPVRFGLAINGTLPGLFRAALFSGDFNRHILEQLQSGKLE